MLTSRTKRMIYGGVAAAGIFAGASGIATAATGSAQQPQESSTSVKDANEPAGDTGINCENGIDTATSAECDGGPSAAKADEATEMPDANEASDASESKSDEADGVDHQFAGDEVGDNGDGVPDANEASEAAQEGTATTQGK